MQDSEDGETIPFSFFDSGDRMSAVKQAKDLNKENIRTIKSEDETSCQNPIFAAFAFSLNIDPKLLEIITDGDEQVDSLSGRSSSPAGSGRSSPSPNEAKT